LSIENIINDNNINNITKKYKHQNYNKRIYKDKLDGVYIRLGEDEENINVPKNNHNLKEYKEGNLEAFSLFSTPE